MSLTPDEFATIANAHEIDIAVRRADGMLRSWTTIWVVGVDQDLCVRTWYRRDTGWYGAALRTRDARVRAGGVEADVDIDEVGTGSPELRQRIDDAYRAKYGGGSTGGMVGDEAAATTLRLMSR